MNAFALTYDVENRLATATSGSVVESYLYDESNHRVEKVLGSADYLYFYGPGGKLMSNRQIAGGTTNIVADRMYFGGTLLGSVGPGASQDVSTMTDRFGTAVPGYPYGTDKTNSAGNDQPDFATYTEDGTTGFEYANQRYYSASYGRFLSVDQSGRNVNPRLVGTITPTSMGTRLTREIQAEHARKGTLRAAPARTKTLAAIARM